VPAGRSRRSPILERPLSCWRGGFRPPPYFLIFDTLSTWLRASGLSLEVIGFFSLVTLVSTFKFLWAPFIDRAQVPVLNGWLGHRRSWMLLCQGVIMLGLWLLAGTDPSRSLGTVAVFAVLVGFSSATQDIAIDAWRIEAADISRQGVMAAAYQWGYRGGMIVAGAVPLLLAEAFGWNLSYAVMAAVMTVGVSGGAGGAARGAPCHPPDPCRRIQAGPRGRRWNGASASQSSQPGRLFWARVSPPMPACLRAC
jgi:PAT family beta-lactamase induction signal transducer AmpG